MQNAFTFFRPSFRSAKKHLSVFIILLASFAALRADEVVVHHIGVGQGDATLIIALQGNGAGYDTTTILIDAGNSSGKGMAVYNYLNEFLGATRHLNYIITSHLHSDHIGGMPNLLLQLHNNGWRVDYILDRGATMQPLPHDSCYSAVGFVDNDTVQPVDLPGSTVFANYEYAVNQYFPNRRYNPTAGVDLFRVLQRPLNMSMLMVAANGCALSTYGSAVLNCPPNYNPDENDFSYGFLYSFEGFTYFTAGDLGGGPPYLDLETPLDTYFHTYPIADFHFCTYKASHHGSPNSNNTQFIQHQTPSVTIVPSALRSFNGTQLPGQATIQLLNSVGSHIFYTYVYDTQPYNGTISSFRDIVFKVTDPGYDQDIAISLYYRNRANRSPYAPLGGFVQLPNDTCFWIHEEITAARFSDPSAPATAADNLGTVAPASPANATTAHSRRLKRIKRKIDRLERKAAKLETR